MAEAASALLVAIWPTHGQQHGYEKRCDYGRLAWRQSRLGRGFLLVEHGHERVHLQEGPIWAEGVFVLLVEREKHYDPGKQLGHDARCEP